MRFNAQCKDFREVATEEQREALKAMQSTLLKGSIPSSLVWTKSNITKEEILLKFDNDASAMRKHYKSLTGKDF